MKKTIRITLVDQLGTCKCHRGHKVGDCWDYDSARGSLCPMAMHTLFPMIDILRYGGSLPVSKSGDYRFCCPDIDVINDHFDTIDPNSTDSDIAGIKNWFYEFFAKDTSRKIRGHKKRLGELDRLFIRIYEDNVAGRITDEKFSMMSKTYEDEQAQLKVEIQTLQQLFHRISFIPGNQYL